jgi:hypothetical protein
VWCNKCGGNECGGNECGGNESGGNECGGNEMSADEGCLGDGGDVDNHPSCQITITSAFVWAVCREDSMKLQRPLLYNTDIRLLLFMQDSAA